VPHVERDLALVLHTHMPYVEGFGTWPFGEEWLWEAVATSYLPLLDVLDERVTLSVTPVLLDQLEAPGVRERLLRFLREVRPESHERDAAAAEDPAVAAELRRAAGDYARAAEELEHRDLGAELAARADWTSSATHAVLPLLATDAGVRLQVDVGIDAHRRRRGEAGWAGGFWSPECARGDWIDPLLAEAGAHATCVDLTDVPGVDHLRPLRGEAGVTLVPIDRSVLELVWSDRAYPGGAAYRDTHKLTAHHHKPWRCDGAVYDPDAAAVQARADARDFVERAARRLEGGGLCVCALDTELLGHWWYEGVTWLDAVAEECDRQGVRLAGLDDALTRHEPVPAPPLPVTTWGRPRDLSTWSAPRVAEFAWRARDAELRAVAAAATLGAGAVRELLALQASDWAFVVSEGLAEPYGRARAEGHRAAFDAALAGVPSPAGVRNLAPWATSAPLRSP